MADHKKAARLVKEIEEIDADIDQFKKLCRELKAAGDNDVCTPSLRKRCASGQHGLKDNATNRQVREGLEERIDQLKRDRDKKAAEVQAALKD
jgi:hypothetical protein